VEYVSEETPMSAYANLHLAFEQMRIKARRAQRGSPSAHPLTEAEKQPPRVLIVGPENSGKTTACKILANYAVRAGQGWIPMLVNLDPGEVGLFLIFWVWLIWCLGSVDSPWDDFCDTSRYADPYFIS